MTLNCIHIFIVTDSFLYWCVIRPSSQRFFIHSCIYLRILIISYLATSPGTDSLSVLMCRKAVNHNNTKKQSINQSINQSIRQPDGVVDHVWHSPRNQCSPVWPIFSVITIICQRACLQVSRLGMHYLYKNRYSLSLLDIQVFRLH